MVIAVAMWDERFKPVNVTIGFKHIVGEHSGLNLAENFYETVGCYRLNNNVEIFCYYLRSTVITNVFFPRSWLLRRTMPLQIRRS